MRIIVNGMQAFGKAVVDKLVGHGEDVVAVYGPGDSKSGRVDPIIEAAVNHRLPIFQPKSFKTEDALEEILSLRPDLCVMAFVTKFVPSTFLNVPKLGSIQYHPSLLPKHRGPSSINWPIIQGSTQTGLTIFWPDDGLDTGPILLQKKVTIKPDDTLGSLYFQKLFPMGVDAMIDAVDLVKEGKAPKIEQDNSLSTYESWCKKENTKINWGKTGFEVYNLIRGSNPQPGAWTIFNDKSLEIFDCYLDNEISGQPGLVVGIDAERFIVATSRGGIGVKRVRYDGREKVTARDFADLVKLKEGDDLNMKID